ncbi:MAG: trypsin-like peptidase domain-containing protein [Planctomycetaceae bacterium]|nr:trypsin-like peptidase domain-containing protein [Planctomycetaceae bacterium]
MVSTLAVAQTAPTISPEDLAAVRAAEAARIQAIDSVYGAIVAIYGNDRAGGGSGVLFDPAGYALTNHHVVGGAGDGGWAGLADGKLYRWKLIGTDPGGDVAIIRLTGQEKFPAAPIGDSDTVRIGDWAMAMGNPFTLAEDQRPTVTLGIVSGVHRFQEGSGLNQLVYGNCIQVDSSINPGNSGGPLFNLRGQVIGINGRGSFEERGRVNVGLGYAISSNQIKNFIPELLSTKVAQHGTLDAVFGTRSDGVICHTVNLDSSAARKGLELGDRLVAFEGVPIIDANQFTNLITLYPAGWPVEVKLERGGVQKTIHVRLTALPYEPVARPTIKPDEEKKPEEKPAEEKPAQKPADEKPAEEKPAEEKKPDMPPELPRARLVPPKPKLELGEPGKIRLQDVNREIAGQILSKWKSAAGASGGLAAKALRIESEIRRGEDVCGKQLLIAAGDGRVRAEYEIDGRRTVIATDGSKYWLVAPGKEAAEVTSAKAILDPHFAQAAVLGTLLADQPLVRWGELALEGSDKANRRLCYRLAATDPSSEQLFVWLSVYDADGMPRIELVKSGVGTGDEEPIPSTLYADFRPVEGLPIPHRRTLVIGLAEQPLFDVVTTKCELPSSVAEELFKQPGIE